MFLLLINRHTKNNPLTGRAQYVVRECIRFKKVSIKRCRPMTYSPYTKTLFIPSRRGYRRGVRINPRTLIAKKKGQL